MRLTLASFLLALLAASGTYGDGHPDSSKRLSPYGWAKPVLLTAAGLPSDFENKDSLDVLDSRTDRPPNGLYLLKSPEEHPPQGKVGVHIPSGAVLRIKGRSMVNLGSGVVTLRLAKSAKLPERSIRLEGRRTADFNEMCRCAVDRAAGNPYPQEKLAVPCVTNGTLVIVGGGGMPADISKRFLNAGGGAEGHFVVLPIAMPDPVRTTSEENFLKRMGAKNVTAIPYREQKDLEKPEVLAILKKATGIWFGGGRQWHFIYA
jgi:cyanophycinase